MKPYRIVVTGSRDWTDVKATIDALVFAMSIGPGDVPFVIAQGGALGADLDARAWAATRNIPVETFEADWAAHGKAAGPIRNRRMLDAGADVVLAFPIGGPAKSRGTWDCIRAAAERGIPVRIYSKAAP